MGDTASTTSSNSGVSASNLSEVLPYRVVAELSIVQVERLSTWFEKWKFSLPPQAHEEFEEIQTDHTISVINAMTNETAINVLTDYKLHKKLTSVSALATELGLTRSHLSTFLKKKTNYPTGVAVAISLEKERLLGISSKLQATLLY